MNKETERSGRDAAVTPRPTITADRMETARCIVRIKGDVQNEVPRFGVTAPEIILLRAIHGGNDAVYRVEKDGEVAAGSVNERIRLLTSYPRYTDLFASLFPGLAPQFPRTIAEVEAMVSQELERQEREAEGGTAPPPLVPLRTNPLA